MRTRTKSIISLMIIRITTLYFTHSIGKTSRNTCQCNSDGSSTCSVGPTSVSFPLTCAQYYNPIMNCINENQCVGTPCIQQSNCGAALNCYISCYLNFFLSSPTSGNACFPPNSLPTCTLGLSSISQSSNSINSINATGAASSTMTDAVIIPTGNLIANPPTNNQATIIGAAVGGGGGVLILLILVFVVACLLLKKKKLTIPSKLRKMLSTWKNQCQDLTPIQTTELARRSNH